MFFIVLYNLIIRSSEIQIVKNSSKKIRNNEFLEKIFLFLQTVPFVGMCSNESMNGLVGLCIPKGTDFGGITNEFVAGVEDKLNERLRKEIWLFCH